MANGKRRVFFAVSVAVLALLFACSFAVISSANGAQSRTGLIFTPISTKSNSETAQALMGDAFPKDSKGILSSVENDSVMAYYLQVDGVPVARADTEDVLTSVLDTVLAEYSVENATEAYFVQETAILRGYVSRSLPSTYSEIYKLLSPASENGLTVLSIFSSDVLTPIPYGTVTIVDEEAYPFESGKELSSGKEGTLERYTSYTFVNGELVSYIYNEKVIQHPRSRTILCGTKEYSYESTGEYIWPAEGKITSNFGYRSDSIGSSNHQGTDIANSYGTKIRAADSGTVIYVGWMRGYGKLIQIRHDNGDITYYAHLAGYLVKEGDIVYQGQEIAHMGNTGVSSGTHLHFEIRKNGSPVDPLKYLP